MVNSKLYFITEAAKALKGASEDIRDKFFRNMSTRAAGALQEDMEYMGPVRMSDIRDAQAKITAVMMSLAAERSPKPGRA